MCVYVCVCVGVICRCGHICVCMCGMCHKYVWAYLCVCVSACNCVCVKSYVLICVHASMQVCVQICVCVAMCNHVHLCMPNHKHVGVHSPIHMPLHACIVISCYLDHTCAAPCCVVHNTPLGAYREECNGTHIRWRFSDGELNVGDLVTSVGYPKDQHHLRCLAWCQACLHIV